MDPVGQISKAIQSFGNVMTNMTNPFTPLLFANLIIDLFTLAVFYKYPNIWIWVFALIFWLFTGAVYLYFALKAPHMLSAISIQKFGMQLVGMGQKEKVRSPEEIQNLPAQAPIEGELIEKPKKRKK